MLKKMMIRSAMAFVLAAGVFANAGAVTKNKKSMQSLAPGSYTATVKALVCGGCGPLLEKTLLGTPGIGAASVNSETKTVSFTVKNGSRVPLTELQKNLKAAAGQMGMGADYELRDLKPVTK